MEIFEWEEGTTGDKVYFTTEIKPGDNLGTAKIEIPLRRGYERVVGDHLSGVLQIDEIHPPRDSKELQN